jgi:hypothetical protein
MAMALILSGEDQRLTPTIFLQARSFSGALGAPSAR